MKSLWLKRRVYDDSYSSEVTMHAFPNQHNPQTGRQETGMSLRDYFAAKAMQAFVDVDDIPEDLEFIVNKAYIVADLMLKERDK
jgi:hypothetical protein